MKIVISDKASEVIEEFFESILSRYKVDLETTMKISSFIFDYEGKSSADFHYWIGNKKVAINPNSENDDNYFWCAVTLALNHKGIGESSERISKIKPLMEKYNSEGINYPSKKEILNKSEKNNWTIA